LSPEQSERMMAIWGKIEADMAENANMERVCWYIFADGGGGFTVADVADPETADTLGFETALALGEFLELETRPVHDLDTAMPAIMSAMERIKV
jgi:hypothetical protein